MYHLLFLSMPSLMMTYKVKLFMLIILSQMRSLSEMSLLPPPPQPSTMSWQTPDVPASSLSHHSHQPLTDFKSHAKDNDDVELMSSDSSSSSSSDEWRMCVHWRGLGVTVKALAMTGSWHRERSSRAFMCSKSNTWNFSGGFLAVPSSSRTWKCLRVQWCWYS